MIAIFNHNSLWLINTTTPLVIFLKTKPKELLGGKCYILPVIWIHNYFPSHETEFFKSIDATSNWIHLCPFHFISLCYTFHSSTSQNSEGKLLYERLLSNTCYFFKLRIH